VAAVGLRAVDEQVDLRPSGSSSQKLKLVILLVAACVFIGLKLYMR
jgi:hypothetical protein